MTSLGDKIRRNAMWLVGSAIVMRALNFIIGIVLARLLVPEDFGLVATVAIFTGFAGFFASGGMGDALVRAPEVEKDDYSIVFTAQLTICTIIFVVFFVISPYFAVWFNDPRYELLMRVSALSFLTRPFINVPSSLIARQQRFAVLSTINVIILIVSSSTSIYLAVSGAGVWALVFGGLVGACITIPIMAKCARWAPAIRFELARLRKLGTVGFQFTINHIVLHWNRQIGFLVITRFMGPATLGLFTRASSLSSMPRELIIGASSRTLFRGFAEIQDNRDQSQYLLLHSITIFSVYTMPFYVGLWWIAEPFILIIYGDKWSGVIEPLRVLCFCGLFLAANPAGAIMAAQGHLAKEIGINSEIFVVTLVASLLGMRFGLIGMAYALAFAWIYGGIRLYVGAFKCVGLPYGQIFSALFPSYLLNAILFFSLFVTHQILVGADVEVRSTIYLSVMIIIGGLAYGVSFLTIPINHLSGEVDRWKRHLRFGQRLRFL